MKGETIEHNGKTYTLQRGVKVGEFSRLTKLNREILELSMREIPDMEKLGIDEFKKMLIEQSKKNEEIGAITISTLKSLLGLTDEELDDLEITDAVDLFQKTWTVATTVKKNLDVPLDSPTS